MVLKVSQPFWFAGKLIFVCVFLMLNPAVLGCLLAAATSGLVGGGVVLSILSRVRIDDSILFHGACFALLRLLPISCLSMICVLALLSRAVGGCDGPVVIFVELRGLVAVHA